MFRIAPFALAAVSFLSVFDSARAAKSECRCRKAKNGVYLELITYKNDDSMKISALESFTMKDNAQNLANCQADIKSRPSCGGVAPNKESTAKVYTIKIEPKQMNESFYKIGLLPGDQVISIDKAPVKSSKRFKQNRFKGK